LKNFRIIQKFIKCQDYPKFAQNCGKSGGNTQKCIPEDGREVGGRWAAGAGEARRYVRGQAGGRCISRIILIFEKFRDYHEITIMSGLSKDRSKLRQIWWKQPEMHSVRWVAGRRRLAAGAGEAGK
jgi:hypothetical protein